MIVTTTHTLQGIEIEQYLGIVSGVCIMGANIFRDFNEQAIDKAKNEALDQMKEKARKLGANAIIGIDIDYETIRVSMLMVAVSGTAVKTK